MDILRTRQYYHALGPDDLCQCDSCRNFYAGVRAAYPDVSAWLEGLGVDIEKPFESFPLGCGAEGYEEYLDVQYIVFGDPAGFNETEVQGVSIGLAGSHPVTEIEEPHFVIELKPFLLTWRIGSEKE